MTKPLPSTLLPPADDAPPASSTVSSIPAFKFPFAPATFAPKPTATKPWEQKGSTARHEKKIGMAPKGTRRAMGKR